MSDVYLEKPMTYAIDEGPAMIAAAEKSGRILQVGSQGISSRLQQTAREIIKSGKLEQVNLVRASYDRNSESGAWLYPIPPDADPTSVNWDQFLGPAPKRSFSLERFFRWRCYWDYSGGISTDLFVHLMPTIHYVMDPTAPETVVATAANYRHKKTHEAPDTINASAVYGKESFTVSLSGTFNSALLLPASEASTQTPMRVTEVADSTYLLDCSEDVAFSLSEIAYLLVDDIAVLIEPGSTTTASKLLTLAKDYDLDFHRLPNIIPTHIHVDHGGGAGYLVQQLPNAKVVLHPRGAKNMVEPSKLVSATKLVFGEDFELRFGPIMPIPEKQVHVAQDSEAIHLGKRDLTILFTPGHASHHISIRDSLTEGILPGERGCASTGSTRRRSTWTSARPSSWS